MQPRFTIRTLLILTALVASACYWVARPTMDAKQFVRAVETKNFAEADRLFSKASDAIFVDYQARFTSGSQNCDIRWHVQAQPRTWRDLLAGRCRISLAASYAVGGQGYSPSWLITVNHFGTSVEELPVSLWH